jgi:indole-3-glycerol phosphate synthase
MGRAMADILDTIVKRKREEVADRKRNRPESSLVPEFEPRDFASALQSPGLSVIAEIKRRSPSKGPLRLDLDPADLARNYEQNGAACLSVLTDDEFFGGSLADLRQAREATAIPVLRKDFTIDAYQIRETRWAGGDAVLLIARILSEAQLADYHSLAAELGLACLVEAHCQEEVHRATRCGARIVGVNNRNLKTFEVDTETAARVRACIPDACISVSESGVRDADDVQAAVRAGFDAVLIGEALVTADDPGAKLASMLALPTRSDGGAA